MDNVLEFLVQAGNRRNFGVDITLNVKGSIIKGTLISAQEYFESLSKTFEEGNEYAQELSKHLKKTGEIASSNKGAPAQFIHLKDAEVYIGDSKPTPSQGEILWRGKLDEVDSFYIDQVLEKEKTSQDPSDEEEESTEEESEEEESEEEESEEEESEEEESEEDNEGFMNRLDQLEDKVKDLLPGTDEEEPDEKNSNEDSSPKEASDEEDKKSESKKSTKSKKDSKDSGGKSKKEKKSSKDKKDSSKKK